MNDDIYQLTEHVKQNKNLKIVKELIIKVLACI